jgi:hypothetical protein
MAMGSSEDKAQAEADARRERRQAEVQQRLATGKPAATVTPHSKNGKN